MTCYVKCIWQMLHCEKRICHENDCNFSCIYMLHVHFDNVVLTCIYKNDIVICAFIHSKLHKCEKQKMRQFYFAKMTITRRMSFVKCLYVKNSTSISRILHIKILELPFQKTSNFHFQISRNTKTPPEEWGQISRIFKTPPEEVGHSYFQNPPRRIL